MGCPFRRLVLVFAFACGPALAKWGVGISVQQFEQMNRRLAGRPSRAAGGALAALEAPVVGRRARVILGVDPSLRGTGYGVIRTGGGRPVTLAQGTIACPKDWLHSRCLALIYETLQEVVRTHQPDTGVLEGLFFAQNLKTAIVMGQARGAALAALGGAGLDLYELAPRKVKLAVVGHGGAGKLAVAKMVQRMLALAELPAPDAADALALAIAFAQEQGRYGLNPPAKI